ncbi:required for excision 1-B domain-containing protein-like [Aotus nancymaae]|uniref:required for excision 1-B domain-containing protein-like n=1 Tax=Aotus nancymaae TaxID=37293 RepID=UPI0030FEF95E
MEKKFRIPIVQQMLKKLSSSQRLSFDWHHRPAAEAATEAPGHEGPAWPWKDAPIQTLVPRIYQLQAERTHGFRRLEEGQRQYLRSSPDYDFVCFRSTVHEVTQAFAAASREVLAVEAELAGPGRQLLLTSHVRSLQQLEQTRLGTVALLQLMETPEVVEQKDAVQMHQLKMKVIKTITLVIVSFAVQKLLILIRSYLSVLAFVAITCVVFIMKSLPMPRS